MSRRASASVSAAVGSSRIRISAFFASAFAISTICCWPIPSSFTGCETSTSRPTRSRARRASLRTTSHWMRPRRTGSRPSMRFSATESSGTRASSWAMRAMPCSSASRRLRKLQRAAPKADLAAVAAGGVDARESTLMRVLLPAPFSPQRAWISPRPRSKETPSRARTPGNSLVIERSSRSGSTASATGPSARPCRRPRTGCHPSLRTASTRLSLSTCDGGKEDAGHVLLAVVHGPGRISDADASGPSPRRAPPPWPRASSRACRRSCSGFPPRSAGTPRDRRPGPRR